MMKGGSFEADMCGRLRAVSGACGIATALVGVGVMIGWFAGIESLKRVMPPLVAMHPLTAIGLVLGGISLFLQARGKALRTFARVLALILLGMGIVKLLYLHAEWPFSFDRWVYRVVAGNPGFRYGGEMADSVALCFCLTGGALMLLDWTTRRGRRASEYLAVLTWLIAMLAVVGYVYEAKWLYGMTMRVPMALNSAIAFLILSMGIAFARPGVGLMAVVTGDSPGGVMARRMLPAMVVVFVLAGGLRIAGQVHGLYSAELGVVLHAVNSIVIFGVFIMWCARSLHRLHQEQKRMEEERERFFNLSLDLLCVAGMDGYFKKVNPAFTRTLGFSEVEMLSRPFTDFIHPDDLAATLAEVDTLGTGASSVHFENRYRCKDGSWKWLSWNTQPFVEEKILYAVARDITEKKEAEFSILFLNEELTQQASRLEAVNKELESFSYSVSHDLRAPLRGISGFAQALEEHAGERLDETDRSYLQRVQRAAQRMGLLIDDLLKLSRLSRAEMKLVPVDLSVLATAAVAALRSAEPERQVNVEIDPDIHVAGDPALLRVVLDNLLGNAWKFTAATPDARIGFSCKPPNAEGKVICTVQDNGAGFDMRYVHKLFGPFQRLHTQAEFPGSGIGLATVQRIIRRHGGDVSATGEINHGAAFEFTLEAVSERNRDEPEIHPAR
ncbi:MAG: PAS domain S-box protein [Verrucomicrobiaceae bacterium]|nr:MAG: PAS domain S-box protein [Verrucomicrobiaceae bacterium]